MPRINTYTSQVQTQGAVGTRRANVSDLNLGQGIQQLSAATQDVASALHQRKVQQDQFEAQKMAIEEESSFSEWMSAAKQSAPAGAPDFSNQVKEEAKKRFESALEKAPSTSRDTLELRLSSIFSRAQDDAIQFQAKSAGLHARNELKGYLDKLENSARASGGDAKQLETALESQALLINSRPGLDETSRAQLLQESRLSLYNASIDGRVTNLETSPRTTSIDIDRVINELSNEKGPWVSNLSSEDHRAQLTRLKRLKETYQHKEQAATYADFNAGMDQFETTGVNKSKYNPEWIQSNVPDPLKRDEMIKRYKIAEAVGKEREYVQSMPLDSAMMESVQQHKIIESLKQVNPSQYEIEKPRLMARAQALKAHMNAYQDDQAGYIMQLSSAVQNQYKALSELQDDGTEASAKKKRELTNNYLETSKAEQLRLFPGTAPTVLTKDQIGQFKAQMAAIPHGERGAAEAVQVLQKQAALYGKHWPEAVRDLRNAKAITPGQYVAANLFSTPTKKHLAEEFVKASAIPRNELLKRTTIIGLEKKAQDAANKSINKFVNTLDGMAGGSAHQVSNTIREALVQQAIYRSAISGEDKTSEIDDLADEIIYDNYTIKDEYRVPIAHDADVIEDSVDHLLSNIHQLELANMPVDLAGLRPEDQKKRYLKNVVVRTKGDDSGLRVMDAIGNPVFIKRNGKTVPLEYTWGELKALKGSSLVPSAPEVQAQGAP